MSTFAFWFYAACIVLGGFLTKFCVSRIHDSFQDDIPPAPFFGKMAAYNRNRRNALFGACLRAVPWILVGACGLALTMIGAVALALVGSGYLVVG